MAMSVQFCLSYDALNRIFRALKKANFNRKHNLVTNDIITLHASNQVLRKVWSWPDMDFHDMILYFVTRKPVFGSLQSDKRFKPACSATEAS